jgi:hypothetical protein
MSYGTKRTVRNALVVWGLFAAAGCDNSSSGIILPDSNGSPGELLVVADDSVWFGGTGLVVAETLGGPMDGLPQSEPKYKLTRIPHAAFKPLLQRCKALLRLVVQPDSVGVYRSTDVWASPQLVITVVAARAADFPELLKREQPRLEQWFGEHDRAALAVRLKQSAQPLPEELKVLGLNQMQIPSGFGVTLAKDTLVIMRLDGKKTTQFLMCSRSRWTPEWRSRIQSTRDTLLKRHFEGGQPESYMATEMRLAPTLKPTQIDGLPAVETRGLWRTYGDFMGGPFLSYAVADSAGGWVYALNALVYSPGTPKRLTLLEFETTMRGARFRRNKESGVQ